MKDSRTSRNSCDVEQRSPEVRKIDLASGVDPADEDSRRLLELAPVKQFGEHAGCSPVSVR